MGDVEMASTYTRGAKKARSETQLGEYKISDTVIGEGSTGKVMLAYHMITGKPVAVKVVNKSSKWLREEAQKEIQILGKLNHKNIIKIDAVEEDEKSLYLFTEYLEERDIYTYMQRNGRFTEEQAFALFKQITAALKNCHENKICHHDVKLENCVINKEMDMKLIDFAYALEFHPPNSSFLKFNGSPAYSAPEILFRKPHNETVDIFGLGTCLYYMICHCFPFCDEDNTSYEELCQNVRLFNLEFPEDVSTEAKDLITVMLAKDKRPSFQDIKNHPWYKKHNSNAKLNLSQSN